MHWTLIQQHKARSLSLGQIGKRSIEQNEKTVASLAKSEKSTRQLRQCSTPCNKVIYSGSSTSSGWLSLQYLYIRLLLASLVYGFDASANNALKMAESRSSRTRICPSDVQNFAWSNIAASGDWLSASTFRLFVAGVEELE